MRPNHISSDAGSAILEFVSFVLVGQLLVFGGSFALATELTAKVELQILASQIAKTLAQEAAITLPAGVEMIEKSCGSEIICVTFTQESRKVSAVSFR